MVTFCETVKRKNELAWVSVVKIETFVLTLQPISEKERQDNNGIQFQRH